jgi:hypothetical protein
MNIFVLDLDYNKAAQYHNDRHVVKMILETSQILSTALRMRHYVSDTNTALLYRETHKHHPCVKWAAKSTGNCLWLLQLGRALTTEYTYRYGKQHACVAKLDLITSILSRCAIEARTPFVLAMPDDCKGSDPVASYRDYYIRYKNHLAKWTRREKPSWYTLEPQGSTND